MLSQQARNGAEPNESSCFDLKLGIGLLDTSGIRRYPRVEKPRVLRLRNTLLTKAPTEIDESRVLPFAFY